MASERNYRKEAVSARRAARDTLRSLREARRQSKVRAQKPASSSKTSGQGSLIEPDAFFSINQAPPEPLPEDADQRDAPASDLAAATDGTAETSSLAEDAADHENQAPATGNPESIEDENEIGDDTAECSAEPVTGDVELTDVGQSDEQVGSDEPASTGMEDLGTADPNSDLFDLPGAGAGIVWMFHQCGIRTLSDLARADAQELSAKLGVVGHILNIQPWITYASEVEADSAE